MYPAPDQRCRQATVQKIIALRVSEFLQKELGPDFFPEWPAPDEKSIKDNVKEWSFGTWP